VKLNLGSGHSKGDGYINIDIDKTVNPDLVLDVSKGLPYDDNSVDKVRAFDFLEHIPIGKTIFVVDEIWRVLKPGGIFEHLTPSTDGRGAFQDPTHVSFWNINSWLYFCDTSYTGVHNHTYGIKSAFLVESLQDIISDNKGRVVHTHGILRKG
jgi:SAM-dependent methyltransferase